MAYIHPAWVEYQRKRFARPDAARWMGSDAARYCGADYDARAKSEFQRRRFDPVSFRSESLVRKFQQLLRKALHPGGGLDASASLPHYLTQPRVPSGNPDGGQWTEEGGLNSSPRFAQANEIVTDATGRPYYSPGGHHEMAKGVYKNWDLRPETRAVFDGSTTGRVPATIRSTPDGWPFGNIWDGPNGPHAEYNRAIRELSERFLERNGITPEQMMPDHARALLKEIRDSEDPRIRNFNNTIRFIQRLYRLRIGRGIE